MHLVTIRRVFYPYYNYTPVLYQRCQNINFTSSCFYRYISRFNDNEYKVYKKTKREQINTEQFFTHHLKYSKGLEIKI